MAEYVQKFPGKISVAGLDSSEPVTAPQFNGNLNGNATNATNAETATAVPATLVPNNADLNDYRGENYWGKRFYAGGNNSVQNLPYSYSAGFSLEVLKSGSNSTIQRLSAMTSEGNNIPTIYTRSVTDVVTGDGTWSEWQEVAEANGTYPKMKVGEAQKLSMRANVSGAGKLGWYKLGTVTVEGLKAIQNTNASYSLFMLVNGANPPGTNNSAARSGIVEIDTAVGSGGQLQLENGYTAIKALCGNIDVNDFAVGIDSAGTTLTVYMDARENGVGTRTAFSIISEVYGAISGSAFEFGWEYYGAAAPADAIPAAIKNNASGAEHLSRFAYLFAGASQTGWWKLGSIKADEMGVNQNRSCVFLVNGVLLNQGLSTAGETGFLEFDVRKESAIVDAKLSVLGGNLNAEEFCAVLSQTEATVYIKLPSQYNAFAVTMISEDGASASKASPLFEFDTQFIGSSTPSGAQYAVVRNNASRAEATLIPNGIDINTYRGNDYWGKTYYAGGSNTVQNIPVSGAGFILEVLRSGSASTVQRLTTMAAGSNNQPTVYTRSVVDSTTAADGTWTAWTEVAEANGTYPNMTVGKATNATNATNATHAASATNATNATNATTAAMANTLAESGHKTLLWSGTLSNGESLDKFLFDAYSVLLFKDNTGAYWIAEFGDFINSGSFGQIKTTMVTSARITMTLCGLVSSADSSEYSMVFAEYEYSISNGSINGSSAVSDRWLTNIWGLEAFRIENG